MELLNLVITYFFCLDGLINMISRNRFCVIIVIFILEFVASYSNSNSACF